MFFKTISAYQLAKPLDISKLADQLSQHTLRQPGDLELSTMGFVPVAGTDDQLVRTAGKYSMIRLAKVEKIIPTQVLNSETQKIVDSVEASTGIAMGKKLINRTRDDVLVKLMKTAFHKTTYTNAIISRDYIFVEASMNGSENLLSKLRGAVESLPAYPWLKCSLATLMTLWVTEGHPKDTELLNHIRLIGGDGQTAVFKNQSIHDTPQVESLISDGYFVDELSMEFNRTMSFILSSEGVVRRVKFLDGVADDDQSLDADIIVAGFEMTNLIIWLKEVTPSEV